jgi:hypothetical protein
MVEKRKLNLSSKLHEIFSEPTDQQLNVQVGPDSIRQFLISWQLPSIDNKRYFPIFPCVVGLIGY